MLLVVIYLNSKTATSLKKINVMVHLPIMENFVGKNETSFFKIMIYLGSLRQLTH